MVPSPCTNKGLQTELRSLHHKAGKVPWFSGRQNITRPSWYHASDRVSCYMHPPISADLSKRESVLDYIVINQYLPILQTPISHYCNTLQSPILQIAIFLCCRVQLALLHHLKGVGQMWNCPPQAATGRHRLPQAAPTFWPHNPQQASKSPEINGHQ